MTPLLLVLALGACAKTADPEAALQRPEPLPASAFVLPAEQRFTLSNGVEVLLLEDHSLPLFSMELVFKAGAFTDPAGKEGLASAAMGMLNEGTQDKDPVAFAAAVRALGSTLWAGAGSDRASLSLSGLSRNLAPTLDLAAEVLFKPRFAAGDWARLQKQRLQDVQAARANPQALAGRAMGRALYGDAWPGRVVTEQSLQGLDLTDLRAWHAASLVPANALIAVSGDVDAATLRALLEERLGDWPAGFAVLEPPLEPPARPQTTLTLVDKPGAAQSVLQLSVLVPSRAEPGWDALVLANQIWGGSFTSRLNMNLREDKGWTYGARSDLTDGLGPGVWTASSAVRADATVDALREILAELDRAVTERPFTAVELEYHRSSLVLGYPGRFETPDYLLSQQVGVWRYGLPSDWVQSYISRVQGVSLEQAQAAFAQHIASQPLAIVVVGDLATLREGLSALGYPVTQADADGRPLTP